MGSNVILKTLIRLYHGHPNDREIADYLEQYARAPEGTVSGEAKRLMYLGLQAMREGITDPGAVQRIAQTAGQAAGQSAVQEITQVTIDETQLRRAIEEVLVKADLGGGQASLSTDALSDIRDIIDAVLSQKISPETLQRPTPLNQDSSGSASAALQKMGGNLTR